MAGTYSQELALLSGSDADRRQLLDSLIAKAISSQLDDTEIIILETVKKMLLPQPISLAIPGEMSAIVYGKGDIV